MSGAAFLGVNLLLALAAWAAANRFLPDRGLAERLLAAALFFLSQIALTGLLLGLVFAALRPLPWLAVNAALAVPLLAWGRSGLASSFAAAGRSLAGLGREALARRPLTGLLVLLFLLQAVLLLAKIHTLPPDVGDVYSYHLHPAVEWGQQGRITDVDSPVRRVNRNPYTPKLLHLWATLAGDSRWVELPQFLFGLLVPLAVYALLTGLGVARANALRYGLLAFFTPVVLIESRTCQDHLVLTAATLLALLYTVHLAYSRRVREALLLGLALGWVLGSKISGPQVLAVLGLARWLCRSLDAPPRLSRLKRYGLPLLGAAGLALLLGGYWYVKDAAIRALYLNKLASLLTPRRAALLLAMVAAGAFLWRLRPRLAAAARAVSVAWGRTAGRRRTAILLLVLLAGAALWHNRQLAHDFLLARRNPAPQLSESSFFADHPLLKRLNGPLLKNLLLFPYRIKDIGHFSLYTPDLQEQSGFGVAFLAFGLPAFLLAAAALRRRSFRRSPTGLLTLFPLLLLLSYFAYYYSAANYRLFAFFPLLGLVLWGRLADPGEGGRLFRRTIDALLVAMVAWNGAVCLFEGHAGWRQWKTTLTVADPLQRTPSKFSLLLQDDAWQFLDLHVAAHEPIAYSGHFDSPVYPYFDARWQRRIYHLTSLPGFRSEPVAPGRARVLLTPELTRSLRRRGIRYIHLNRHGAHHRRFQFDRLVIDDPRAVRLAGDLYFFPN